jgi:RNA polymerase-binding transcription factor DksA
MAMTDSQLVTMKEQLESRGKELDDQIASAEEDLRDYGREQEEEQGPNENHPGDEGTTLESSERLTTVLNDLRNAREQVNDALERIANGTYGICKRCGKEIPAERLEALPFVEYDVKCQSEIERENRGWS